MVKDQQVTSVSGLGHFHGSFAQANGVRLGGGDGGLLQG